MVKKHQPIFKLFNASFTVLIPIALWTVLLGGSYSLNSNLIEHTATKISSTRGEMIYRLAELVLQWNIQHGLVYVPLTATNPANPFLTSPDREVTTSSGLILTQMTSPQMLRQLSKLFGDESVSLTMVGTNPINPENRANQWQQAAIEAYPPGQQPYKNIIDGEFRYLVPLIAKSQCLGCHASQQLQLGDLAGGLSVSFPQESIAASTATLQRQNMISHLVAYLLLCLISSLLILKIQRLIKNLNQEKAQRDQIIDNKTANLRAEIKQHKIARSELQRLATHDPLTGITNRRHFTSVLNKEILRYQRYQTNFSLLILDLDHFKQINDTFGHDCGDFVLKEFAAQVQQWLRKSDIFSRYGGEEFAIIAPNTELDSAKRFADKLVRDINKIEIEYQSHKISISVSIGVANPSLIDKLTSKSLIAITDKALYLAKSSGRNIAVTALAKL